MNLELAREKMVTEQLEKRGIRDSRVLAAMRDLPRHRFLQPDLAAYAYEDQPLPIGCGQTISQPYMVALMTEVAELAGTERVLEIGTGSGYQTAVLARMTKYVYSVECVAELQFRAAQTLAELGFTNVSLRLGDGSEGWSEQAPFDIIIVTAAMPGIARPLLVQLMERGRLIAPIGEEDLQSLVRIKREGESWREEYFGECRFVKMTGKCGFAL